VIKEDDTSRILYEECYVDKTVDENKNQLLAQKLINQQKIQTQLPQKKNITISQKKVAKKNDINEILFSENDDIKFDGTQELWHAIVVHEPKVNIYRSDINTKINTKDKAVNNAIGKCWFDPQYTSGDWPSENCKVYYISNNKKFKSKFKFDDKTEKLIVKKKLLQEMKIIKKTKQLLAKGITSEFLGLEEKAYTELKKNKVKKESSEIEKYLNANLNGSDLSEFNLEKETLELVKISRQERKEKLFSEACTGIIFGHRKGSREWFNCLDEEELKSINNGKKIEIVKKDKVIINENKTKTANVKKSVKKEFQPEDNSQDNKAPVIKIAKSFKVNEPSYVIEGEVTDQSDRIFIEVDGKTIQAKNGKFKINRFSPIDEEFNIVAIDQWGNRSEPQLVQITVDTSVSLVADKVEPLNPTKIRSKPDRNKIALIIGIEKYEQTPNASFANLDAKYFYEYARNSFGVSKKNIKILVDEDANLIQSLGTLNKWLPGKVKSNQTEVIIFFAGHGLASNNGEELFLLPQDSDPDLLERTALSRNELFESLLKLNPKSVTMFFDTCFSGISRDEKTLLASARPIRITANEQDDVPNNFTIFSASQLDQISSGLKEAKHGIFSYYLMKGLEGDADLNKDRTITNGELIAYMDDNVSQKASELGRQQNPSLVGNPEQVLARY
jgi:hypothetical protein